MTHDQNARCSPVTSDSKNTIRLFIHENPTADDEEALRLFEELKELVQEPRSLYRDPSFEVRRISSLPSSSHYRLPLLVDGTTWEGLDEIQTFMRINRDFAARELIS